MLSAALWQTGEGRRISLASTRRSCLRCTEGFWGQAVRNMYIFQGFEMAYLARAQMHKRQIPSTAAELGFERRVAFEVEKLSEQEKATLIAGRTRRGSGNLRRSVGSRRV